MFSIERYEKIISELEKQKVVKVSKLADLLDVTEKTIRIDLETLEKRGLLKRVHGGAVLANAESQLLPIEERQSAHSDIKQVIAQEAYKQISPGETILMDGGSTTIEICKLLGDFPLTIITNDLKIASVLEGKENIQLLVLGGTRIPHSSSLIGAQATELLSRLRVNHLFFGTTGISVEHGLTVFNSMHADWKKQILATANHVTLVADSSKFEKVALIQFAALEEIDEIITDARLSEETKSKFSEEYPTLTIAPMQ